MPQNAERKVDDVVGETQLTNAKSPSLTRQQPSLSTLSMFRLQILNATAYQNPK